MDDGRVRCFGTSAKVDGLAGVIDLASDGETTCAVLRGGTVHCWGERPRLRREDKPSSSPIEVQGLNDVADLELQYHASSLSHPTWCVVSPAGGVRCTCSHGTGRCSSMDPAAVAGAPASVRAFGTAEVGCALTRDKKVWCWNTHLSKPGRLVPELTGIDELVEYDLAWCARSEEGEVLCFGSNHAGQLGRGYVTVTGDPTEPPTPPETPTPLDLRASALAPGLVITGSGEVRVWGENDEGQRKPDEDADLARPENPDAVAGARLVAASPKRACVLDERGQVVCWGVPAPVAPETPHDLPAVKDAVAISAAQTHVCALRRSGDVTCWGRRSSPRSEKVFEPRSLGVADALDIAVSPSSVCVRTRDRRVRCWGGPAESKGETVAERADAIGFLGETLCVSDAKQTRCTGPIASSANVGARDLAALEARMLSLEGKAPPTPKPPALQAAGPGGSHSWARVRGQACFVRDKGMHCFAGAKDKVTSKPNVTQAVELTEDAILLADGAVASAADPSIRVASPAMKTLVGEQQLAIGRDGAIYGYSFRRPGTLTKRSDLAGIADVVDMAGRGFASGYGCVVRKSGQVSCWGGGAEGEIGLGDRRRPRVVGTVAK
jgi:hypothetical protein